MSLYAGSRARVFFRFRDWRGGVVTPINLASVAEKRVEIKGPRGATIDDVTLNIIDSAAGTAYADIPEGALTAGGWKFQGIADGYRSNVVRRQVLKNP